MMTSKMIIRGVNSRALSAFAIALLISSTAFSSATLESEFELQIPRQFQQKLIEEKWKNLKSEEFQIKWQLPDQVMTTQEIPIEFKGLDLEIKTQLEEPTLGSEKQTELHLQSKDLNAVLSIASVSIDHVVEKEVGGIIGRFRIQARCENIQLYLKKNAGHFGVNLVSQVSSNKLGAAVQDFFLNWSADSWVANDFNCSGVEGFDGLLREQIQIIAADSEKFVKPQRPVIMTALENQLAGFQVDFSGVRELVSSRPDIKVFMEIQNTQDDSLKGIWAKGKIFLEFEKVPNDSTLNAGKSLSLETSLLRQNSTAQARVLLPKDFVKEVTRLSFAANSWVERISSSKIPGFASVMNSRFLQFFIWPELRRYSKSSKFWFDVSSQKDLAVQGEGLNYQVQSTLIAKMWAPRSTTYVPFMDFTIPVNSKLQLSVTKGLVKAKLPSPSLGLGYKWSSDYSRKYSPSTRFSANTIRNKVVDSLSGKTFTFKLPSIPLSEGLSLEVDRAEVGAKSELNLYLK